jgi:hypothetical protein
MGSGGSFYVKYRSAAQSTPSLSSVSTSSTNPSNLKSVHILCLFNPTGVVTGNLSKIGPCVDDSIILR